MLFFVTLYFEGRGQGINIGTDWGSCRNPFFTEYDLVNDNYIIPSDFAQNKIYFKNNMPTAQQLEDFGWNLSAQETHSYRGDLDDVTYASLIEQFVESPTNVWPTANSSAAPVEPVPGTGVVANALIPSVIVLAFASVLAAFVVKKRQY